MNLSYEAPFLQLFPLLVLVAFQNRFLANLEYNSAP